MHWQFFERPIHQIEQDVTQRDDFVNDEVDLSDTLVRETIQNSLDAARSGEQVQIRFSWETGRDPVFTEKLFEKQLDHAREAGLDVDAVDFSVPRAIVIEDFGTTGLSGAIAAWDSNDFCDFWRRHGKSHKKGTRMGRWGLGKLVFSVSSVLGAFFGITIRAGEHEKLLMGATVLSNHELDGAHYPPHTLFGNLEEPESNKVIQVPITGGFVDEFIKNYGITRFNEPGLSIVIPFFSSRLDRDTMIRVALTNYFFPVLAGELVLVFDNEQIDSSNVREMVDRYAAGKIPDVNDLFDFVEEVNSSLGTEDVSPRSDWWTDGKLEEEKFSDDDIKTMREKFSRGELVSVKAPIKIKKKEENSSETWFSLFIKRPSDLSKGHDLYVRSRIHIPGEAKFRERRSLGALIAHDAVISEFLGDAENPAHTKWNGRAEKLRDYVSAENRLRAIRNSLVQLHDILAQSLEEEDESALLDFFSLPAAKKGRKRGTPPSPNPPNPPQPKKKPFRIELRKGGFSILPKDEIDSLPIEVGVKVAYDVFRGNPFAKWSQFDFDLSQSTDISATAIGVSVSSKSGNEIVFSIDEEEFEFTVTGFDCNRDVIVKAST